MSKCRRVFLVPSLPREDVGDFMGRSCDLSQSIKLANGELSSLIKPILHLIDKVRVEPVLVFSSLNDAVE